jgi:signal peptide peptidase SppA
MEPLNQIAVPHFGRAAEYSDIWLIEPRAGAALWQQAQQIDMAAHMAAPARPVESTMERLPGGDGKNVAMIRLQGLLMKQQGSMGASTSTIQARRDIRQAASDPTIQAILLAIDSPGGTAAGTEALASDVRDARKAKPVFAQIDDMGASAAYFVASQAEKVFASNRSSQIGSICTMMAVADVSEAATREGVKMHVFATGPLKGAGMPGAPISEGHAKYFQASVDALQVPFDDAVKTGRRLTEGELQAVKTGAIFTAEEAQRLGLIDGVQSIDSTLAQLTNRGASSPTIQAHAGKGASAMTFEQFCQARGFDPATLTDKQRAALQADFEASQKAVLVAPPVTAGRNGNSEGGSVMGDIEAYNANALRVAELQAVCQEHGNPRVEWNGVTQTAYEHAVKSKLSTDDAKRLCALGKMRNDRPVHSGIAVGVSGADRELVVQAALEQTLRVPGVEQRYSPQILQAAHTHYRARLGLKRLILEAAFANGYQGNMDSLSTDHKGVLQAAFSTMSLPGILSATINKVLLAAFSAVEQAWREIAGTRNVSDFKTVTSYRMTGIDDYKKLPPDGEIEHATFGEESFTNAVDTWAIMFAITRQDQINDDLGAFADKGRRLGRGGALALVKAFWALFNANTAFFVDPSQNYIKGATTLLDATGLALATAKWRAKKDPDGNPLSIKPMILLVPPALEVAAKTLMATTTFNTGGAATGAQIPNQNIWAGAYRVVVSDYLTEAKVWYLLADPQDIATVEVAFLNGNQNPIVESADTDFNTLGIQWRGYFDFGVAFQDARGGLKVKGEA